jgi:hypothetical protein
MNANPRFRSGCLLLLLGLVVAIVLVIAGLTGWNRFLGVLLFGTLIWNGMKRVMDIEGDEAPRYEPSAGHSFNIERIFIEKTFAGFRVPFRIALQCQVTDENEYPKDRKNFEGADSLVADAYRDQVLMPFLKEQGCFFRLSWCGGRYKESIYEAFPVTIERVTEENGKVCVREFSQGQIKEALRKIPFAHSSCSIKLVEFHTGGLMSPALIEENYEMLTDEQKKSLLNDPRFNGYEESLAIHALKRRLEFETQQFQQVHESDWVTITKEQAGRAIKIRWKIKNRFEGLELLGYRKTGGFAPDQFDEGSNGVLVVHDTRTGETFEPLNEGETYFYTFVWRRSTERPVTYWAASRFKVTLMMEEERKLIESTIDRLQRSAKEESPDPSISRALKELGRYRIFENTMRNAEREAIADIEKTAMTDEEKRVEVAKLRDQVAFIREKYQQ